jgi:hypothetical protein
MSKSAGWAATIAVGLICGIIAGVVIVAAWKWIAFIVGPMLTSMYL